MIQKKRNAAQQIQKKIKRKKESYKSYGVSFLDAIATKQPIKYKHYFFNNNPKSLLIENDYFLKNDLSLEPFEPFFSLSSVFSVSKNSHLDLSSSNFKDNSLFFRTNSSVSFS